jgi:hypothetical protein
MNGRHDHHRVPKLFRSTSSEQLQCVLCRMKTSDTVGFLFQPCMELITSPVRLSHDYRKGADLQRLPKWVLVTAELVSLKRYRALDLGRLDCGEHICCKCSWLTKSRLAYWEGPFGTKCAEGTTARCCPFGPGVVSSGWTLFRISTVSMMARSAASPMSHPSFHPPASLGPLKTINPLPCLLYRYSCTHRRGSTCR